ncbi:MAG TPA: L-ribulose-5-phosphate 4-epimerase AraD [Victivallales bacterium]|nr:L-ribulose-5-phosphate 4-epimerase AraD [Victivallales bacterium]HPO90781.1 L-ribulose-5-phosphate 4-epimerase AraD [Victivallales bacterium]HRR28937.1 L-ribulose-5-phosphate 4-epimerase AraD [Victivallales bacterium]HRU01822.1 L-ribulose-5-phosphate 4-epimerase AraD [Victivallales bacterium]
MKFKTLKEEAYIANMELYKRGLALYTFGNASAFDHNKAVFAIKPSGVPYEKMKPDDMVVVDLENNVVEGSLRPSSDTKTHSRLYRSFPDICGVCHTHSTYATAWAQAKKEILILGTTHADHLPCSVPCTEELSEEMINGDYEDNTGIAISNLFKKLKLNPSHVPMVIVASHGPFTWGENAQKAVYNAVILEEIAKIAFLSVSLNPSLEMISDCLIKKHFERKHGKNAYYGQK